MKKSKFLAPVVILVVVIINLFFGLPRLTNYSSVDEHLWTYKRTPNFWNAIARGKWDRTRVNDKPGTTLAVVSGIGLLSENPKPLEELRFGEKSKTPKQLEEMRKINFDFRLPIYLLSLLMMPVFYILIKKLLGKTIALFSIIFIYLSPIVLGISLIINPDSILWFLIPFSLISFLLFQKNTEKKYAFLTGLFFGLALLTKYVASILYPFFIVLIVLNFIFSEKKYPEKFQNLKNSLIGYLAIVLMSTILVFILYPACWEDSKYLWKTTLFIDSFEPIIPFLVGFLALLFADVFLLEGRVIKFVSSFLIKFRKLILKTIVFLFLALIAFILINTYLRMPFYNFQSILDLPKFEKSVFKDLRFFIDGILPGLYILIFTLSPIVFVFFTYSILTNIIKKIKISRDHSIFVFYIILFITAYYLSFSANKIYPIVRYQISIYPLVAIITAIGIYYFINLKKIKKYLSEFNAYFLLILISIFSLFMIKPFYFAYISALLPNEYVLNLNDMGDGSYEAVTFLNTLPDAQNLTIWTDKVAVCEYFLGKCSTSLSKKDLKKNLLKGTFDYFVLSQAREARTINLIEKRSMRGPERTFFRNIYASENPTHITIIGNRLNNFVKVVKNPGFKDEE